MTDAAQRPSGEMRVSRVVFGLGNVIWIAVQYISPLPSTTVDIIYVFICKGAETTCSVPLRYHQLTTTNLSFEIMQQLQLNSYVDIHCHDIWWKPNRSFISRKWRRQTSSSTKYHKLSHLQALLSFSVCQISFCSSTIPKNIPKHASNTLTTSYETG